MVPHQCLKYGYSTNGGTVFPKAMAAHVNRFFRSVEEVSADHIVTAAALTGINDLIGYAIGDPGDGVLVTPPIYGRLKLDFGNTNDLKSVYAELEGTDPFEKLLVEKL